MGLNVLVLGATTNDQKYAYLATEMLQEYGHSPIAVGVREGLCAGVSIVHPDNVKEDVCVDVVTLYIGPSKQLQYLDFILQRKPKKVVFNPGTENPVIQEALEKSGIQCEIACTLVLLTTNQFKLE